MIIFQKMEEDLTPEEQYASDLKQFEVDETNYNKRLAEYREAMEEVPYFEDEKAMARYMARQKKWVIPDLPERPVRPHLRTIELQYEARQKAKQEAEELKLLQQRQPQPAAPAYVDLGGVKRKLPPRQHQPSDRPFVLPVVYQRTAEGVFKPIPRPPPMPPAPPPAQPIAAPIAAAPGAARQRAIIGGTLASIYGTITQNKALLATGIGTALGLGLAWANIEKEDRKIRPLEIESESEEEEPEKPPEIESSNNSGQVFTFTPIKVDKTYAKKTKYKPRPQMVETPMKLLVERLTSAERWTKKRKYRIRMAKVESSASNFKYLAEIKKLKKKRKKQ